MNRKERVLTALNHQEPDRTPSDLGGSRTSSIHVAGYRNLIEKLGIDVQDTLIIDRMMQVAGIDSRVKDALDVDIESIDTDVPSPAETQPEGNEYTDEWGAVRRMPHGGHWYDLSGSPLEGEITARDISRHAWPDPSDTARYEGLRERLEHLRATSDRAICLGLRGSVVHTSQFLRGFEDWYCDMAMDKDLIGSLMDAVLDVLIPVAHRTLELAGDLVDITFVGDDLGTQSGCQVSPSSYREVIKPRQARLFEAMRKGAPNAFIAMHSCGSLHEIIEDLIEIGVQVLNPVQVSAAGMDPRVLKDRYGDRLSFWGGIDTQHTLPFGNPDDVRNEVRQRTSVLGEGGGYICSAVHNIQPEVPVENVLALFDEASKLETAAVPVS